MLYNVHVQASFGSIIVSQRTGLMTDLEVDAAVKTVWDEAFIQLKRRGIFDWKKDEQSQPLHGFDFRLYARQHRTL